MTRIHFIRHGQTHWNLERRIQGQTESQLTELGREQANTIAEVLKSIRFDIAFSSSSDRARDTAQIILQHHPIAAVLDDSLREIFLGHWEGQLYDDIKQRDPIEHAHFWQQPHKFAADGAETFFQLQQRAIAAVTTLARKHAGKEILVVSHGCWIKSVLTYIENRDMADFWQPPQMSNCCHSIIELAPSLPDGATKDPLSQFKIIQYANVPVPQLSSAHYSTAHN